MISLFRTVLAMLLVAILPTLVIAQTLPDETPPTNPPTNPPIEPPLPPGVPLEFPTVLISPIASGEIRMYVLYVPAAGITGTFETSTDLQNWTPTGTPTPQSGGLQVYSQILETDSEFYVRWREQS